jgi:hypothetical protein
LLPGAERSHEGIPGTGQKKRIALPLLSDRRNRSPVKIVPRKNKRLVR